MNQPSLRYRQLKKLLRKNLSDITVAIWLRPIFSDDTDIPLRRLLLADSLKTVFLSPTMHRHGTNQEFFTAKKQARRFFAPGLFHVKQFFIPS